jgi:D-alanine--poly(phosphoribitol) ligase subunit 2
MVLLHGALQLKGKMQKEIKWLLNWFKKKGINSPDKNDILSLNYFEAGWIDSLGIIELICDIEFHFSIRFNELHFQDRRFSTISGLAEIISELSSGGRGHNGKQ